MATLNRYVVLLSGATGLPGESVFFCSSATSAGAELKAFYTALINKFPQGMTVTVPTAGDTINDADGKVNGGWSDAGGGSAGTSTSNVSYAAGTGAYIIWGTNAINSGRRLKGRTFICPIISTEYDTSGTLGASMQSVLQTAGNTLAAAGKLAIWHRNHKGASDGSSSAVTSALVKDVVTSLRSRRF